MFKIKRIKSEKRRSAKLIAAAATVALCFFTAAICVNSAAPAFANSGAPWEEGVTQSGVHSVHENSVLQVESEKLTFKLDKPVYSADNTERYNSSVTAEYTFYNPTDETVNTKMAFPISRRQYVTDDKYIQPVDPVKVNGEAVDYEVRHTYGTYNDFSEDVSKIKDGYLTTDFYTLDLPVTEYIFKATVGDNDGAIFRAKMPQNSSKTRYFCNSDGNDDYFEYYSNNGAEFSIFVLGEDDGSLKDLKWTATRYNYIFDRNMPVDGSVAAPKECKPVTLKEYAFRSYDPKCGISEIDWYNAMFEIINKNGVCAGSGRTPQAYEFTEWYVYESSVAAKSSFTNEVTAVMYPRTYYYYNPDLYGYTYYLSPAQSWATFGTLTVEVQTPMYMQGIVENPSDTNNKFIKTETGYCATFTELPKGELEFSLSSAEHPVYDHPGTEIPVAIGIALLVLICGVPIIALVTILIVFLVKRKKRRTAEAQQQPVQQSAEVPPIPEGETVEDAVGELTVTDPEEKKVYCAYCGKQISASSTFCPYCGGSVQGGRSVQPKPQQNPVSGANNGVNNGTKRVNGLGIAGFVVSLVAWIFVDVLTAFAFILTAVGFGLSLAGLLLKKKYQRVYGLAIAGLVISSAMVLCILIGVFLGILAVLGIAIGG